MTDGNQPTLSAEERRHPRTEHLQAVTIHVGDRTCRGMIQNMSMGGVYIEADQSFAIGQEITISYPSSNNQDEIETLGPVVRTEGSGFAMEYA